MGERSYTGLLPIAYGNEEETMMLAGAPDAPYSSFTEPITFVQNYSKYIPKDIKVGPDSYQSFLQNGGVVYNGGVSGSANLERATPECSTPDEIATAIQANEQLLVQMGSDYVQKQAKESLPTELRLQRRVIDTEGNGRACHDNFEIRNLSWLENFQHSPAELVLMTHLGTRSFMTGAGYVRPSSVHFGQKIQHTHQVNSYGYENSAYRTTDDSDTGARLEIRCSDINISPWAIRQRIGTSALLLTALQTPIANDLVSRVPDDFAEPTHWLARFRDYNMAPINLDGQLKPTRKMMAAIDFQEGMYSIIGESLKQYVDITPEYDSIIKEGVQYCHDMRQVLKGSQDLDYLKDRSDIAVKFKKIATHLRRDREMGMDRTPTDFVSQYWDLKYDHIRIAPGTQGKPRVEYGYGYRYRDSGGFKSTLDEKDVENALYQPPTTTRAFVRGTLIRKNLVSEGDWAYIKLWAGSDDIENNELNGETLNLSQVVISGLSKTTDVMRYVKGLAISQQQM